MSRARVRNGEITIPVSPELRDELDLHDGDELDVRIFGETLALTRMGSTPQERAWERVFSAMRRVSLRAGAPPLTEEEIVEEVKALRRAQREHA